MTKITSIEEARARFNRVGVPMSEFARQLGVHKQVVYDVLAGRKKGVRGDAHKVAVALGLKEGVIVAKDVPAIEALREMQEAK